MDREQVGRPVLLAVILLGFVGLLFGAFVAMIPRRAIPAALMEDMNSLKNIVNLLAEREAYPFDADGRIAAYAAVAPDELEEYLDIFQGARAKKGPTLAEIRAHDYTNFPWVRYRRVESASPTPGRGRAPLFWDADEDEEGVRVVGLSDGSVKRLEDEEFRQLLERHGQR